MADVRLTNAQALKVCELIGKVEQADFNLLARLGLDGTDLGTLRRAALRIMASRPSWNATDRLEQARERFPKRAR